MGENDISEDLLSQLHPLEIKLVPHLANTLLSSIAKAADMQEVEAMRAAQWLANKDVLSIETITSQEVILEDNAKKALDSGMPEERFSSAVKDGAKSADEIQKAAGLSKEEFGASIGILKKAGAIDMKNGVFSAKTKNYSSEVVGLLEKLKSNALLSIETDLSPEEQKTLKDLRKRKGYLDVRDRKEKRITLTALGKKLKKFDVSKLDYTERVTREDLKTGAWKDKNYRSYDVTINVPHQTMGKKHFVQEAMEYIRKIWVEMGFTQMEGDMVASAFWDLDALFVPQDHPAREVQDTFYLENPSRTPIEKLAFDRVKQVHEDGGATGSKGWRAPYSREEAEKLLLRTHTTVLSAKTLWKIKQEGVGVPGKYFIVDKVFRNEKLDWKHLFEFHQVEGIVVDKNVTFAQLIGYLKIFFKKMGYPDVRVRPHHFPYTEPSVEVDVWHPKKKEWVELGGAGVFRPEVTKTLLGEEIPVLAWGLGLERIIVDFFELEDLRDLYRNDKKQIEHMKRFIKVDN